MRVVIAEFKRNMKGFFRQKQAVFFTFMLPAIFLVLLGFALDERKIELKIGVVDRDQTVESDIFIEGLKTAPIIHITTGEKEELEQRLKEGTLVAILEIREGFGGHLETGEAELDVLYNKAQGQSSRIVFGVMNEMLIQVSRQMPGREPPIIFNRIPVEANTSETSYTDFLTPGIIAMSILFICLVPISNFVAARDSQILKRISLTPIRKSQFLAGSVSFQIYVCFILFTFLLSISKMLFGFENRGSYVAASVLILIAAATFISLSFAIGSMARDAKTATGVVNMAINPMVFLGGVFYSTSILPSFFQPIVQALPVTHFVNGLRGIMLQGIGLGDLHKEITILLGWAVLSFCVAIKKMQWIPHGDR